MSISGMRGEGPVILALHGICDSLHTWSPWASKLTSHFRVIRFDLPYFGLTRVPEKHKITKDFYIEFLGMVEDYLGLSDYYLCGHSLGGWIAWNYALKNQQKLKKLILISPPRHPIKPPFLVRATSYKPLRKLVSRYTPKFLADKAIEEIFYDPTFMTEHQKDRYYEILMAEGNRRNYMEVFSMMTQFAHEWPEGLHKLTKETLILWGEKDVWLPVDHASYWERTLPNVTIKTFEKTGHVPQEELVEDTFQAFVDFIRS